MTKKKTSISSSGLIAIFHERLRELPGCSVGISLAVVPHRDHGWIAIMQPSQRSRYPLFGKRFDDLAAELRTRYFLAP